MFRPIRAALAAIAALAATLTLGLAPAAHASTCSCVTTIDGYTFVGVPYYDPSPAIDSAVEEWWALYSRPDYHSLPPVLSISTTMEILGTVPAGQ